MAKMINAVLTASTNSRYPWKDWANGSAWEVIEGEDFTIPVSNFRAMLHGQASRMGMRVRFTFSSFPGNQPNHLSSGKGGVMRYHGCDDSRDVEEHTREMAIETAWMPVLVEPGQSIEAMLVELNEELERDDAEQSE